MLTALRTQQDCLRLPPYGRKVLGLRAEGKAPQLAVLVVDGWEPVSNLDEYAPWVLVIPDDEVPGTFDFRCLVGLFAVVVGRDIERVDALVNQILRFYPKAVYGWPEDQRRVAFYSREAA